MADWTADDLRKLKSYYTSLSGQDQVLIAQKERFIYDVTFMSLYDEVNRINEDFPGLLPPLKADNLHYNRNANLYDLAGIQLYLAACLGRLKAELEEVQNTPVTERIDFPFVRNLRIREIIERDYVEIQRAYISECWKSVIILSGGSIEAIILDRLLQNESSAKAAKSAPAKSDLSKWDLSELIKVAVEIGLVEPSAEILADALRQYRNLVHPGNEVRSELTVSRLEANSALNALRIIHRDLSS